MDRPGVFSFIQQPLAQLDGTRRAFHVLWLRESDQLGSTHKKLQRTDLDGQVSSLYKGTASCMQLDHIGLLAVGQSFTTHHHSPKRVMHTHRDG
jgi:hypothetical protein